jgi:bacillithiol biosynthesis cysteine-adding enzyme BshC
MQLKKFSFTETHAFNGFFIDYIQQKEILKPFYHRFPRLDQFKDQITEKQKNFPSKHREILRDVLREQYQGLTITEHVKSNVNALADQNTFTVTTGHQLNLFTGPLYFIYKIVTVINACKQLKLQYPAYNFVPVYWMASEDHDYDEIKYFKMYGTKYIWETQQKGAVGRFHTTGIEKMMKDVPGDISIFQEAYSKNKTLSAAVRHYVNRLFGENGLLVIDADHHTWKSLFKNVIHDDVESNVVKPLVDKTNTALEALGYRTQIHCREINFFYLKDDIRSRIEKQGDSFKVLDTDISFTGAEIHEEIDKYPERFSPNVILRPLYQEIILPNIAYVGGPAEVIYWLQLKNVFDHFNITFPMLMPRNFAMVIPHEIERKFSKTGLELKDVFEEKNYLFNHWVLKHSPRNLTVGKERTELKELFEKLQERASQVDPTLSPFVAAEGKRTLNSIEKIERKMLRAEKRLHSDKLRQIEAVKDYLFPHGSLQERTDNFLNFYQQDPQFIDKLLDCFDPFDFQFNVLFI